MLSTKDNKRGRKPKKHVFNELTELIKSNGFNVVQTCSELNIAIRNYDNYFRTPETLSIDRLKRISYMVQVPLPRLLNIVLNCGKKSVHWFSDDSLPVDQHLENLRLRSQVKK